MIMDIGQINIIRRKVKYPRIELKTGKPTLILPKSGNYEPVEIISRHKEWLKKKLGYIERLKRKYQRRKIYHRSKEELSRIIEKSIEKYSRNLGIKPEKFLIRKMTTKWGSCSRQKRVSFNLLLRHLPERLIKYVVYHEMSHLLVANHKKSFWQLIRQEFKNPEDYEEGLFGYWFLIWKTKYLVI